MPISPFNQISFYDISSEFDSLTNSDDDNLISLLNEYINIQDFIPFSFYQSYYSSFGRDRKFSLESMLNAYILKNILNLPTTNVLILLLRNSKDFRRFCGFSSVPNKSQFSRFKSTFNSELMDFFYSLVDKTEEFTHEVNPFLASILITDTTGFESYVTENNPKFYQSTLRRVKTYAKATNKPKSFDPEKYAQSLVLLIQMPSLHI